MRKIIDGTDEMLAMIDINEEMERLLKLSERERNEQLIKIFNETLIAQTIACEENKAKMLDVCYYAIESIYHTLLDARPSRLNYNYSTDEVIDENLYD